MYVNSKNYSQHFLPCACFAINNSSSKCRQLDHLTCMRECVCARACAGTSVHHATEDCESECAQAFACVCAFAGG